MISFRVFMLPAKCSIQTGRVVICAVKLSLCWDVQGPLLHHCPSTAPAPSRLQSMAQHASSLLHSHSSVFFFAVVSFRQAPTAAYIPVPPPLFLLMREHCQKAAGTFKRNIFSSCTNTAKILLMIIGFPVNPLLLKKSTPTTTVAIKEH